MTTAMNDWIFLSKDGEDEYINMFARGSECEVTNTQDFVYESSKNPIVLRGILKHKIMKQCWKDQRTFYYVDSGYFGNQKSDQNPMGWKYWHRVVKNNLQHGEIIPRPADRWEKFGLKLEDWKREGRKILIAKPDAKPCKFYGIDLDQWVEQTVNTIKQHTDRPIEIRERAPNRIDRIQNSTLKEALDNDVFALVTFNSVAATESIMYGIPVFTMAPCNAASPVASQDLSLIETPYYPEKDKVFAWACHLAYGQYHVSEFKSGQAYRMLQDNE
jgi:hypothetical protein